MAKARRRRRARQRQEPAVSPFTAQHGDYRPAFMPDLDGQNARHHNKLVRLIVNRGVTTVDRWLFDGGPGFEEPQARAIDHVRALWRRLDPAGVLVAHYDGVGVAGRGGAGPGDREGYLAALHALAQYEQAIGIPYVWQAFENVVRHDMPAGRAGARMARASNEQRAHAKACVGFVASKIAEWRGF